MTAPTPLPASDPRHERLCAYVLGELDAAGREAVEAELARDPALRAERARLAATIGLIGRAIPAPELSPTVQETLRRAAQRHAGERSRPWTWRLLRGGPGLARLAAALLVVAGGALALRAWLGEVPPAEQVARSESVLDDPSLAEGPEPWERSGTLGYAGLGYDGGERAGEEALGGSEPGQSVPDLESFQDYLARAAGEARAAQLGTPALTEGLDTAVGESAPSILLDEPLHYVGPGDSAPPSTESLRALGYAGSTGQALTRRARAEKSAEGQRDDRAAGATAPGGPSSPGPSATPAAPPVRPSASAGKAGDAYEAATELGFFLGAREDAAREREELAPAAEQPPAEADVAAGVADLERLRGLGYVGDEGAVGTAMSDDDGDELAAATRQALLEQRVAAEADRLVLGCRLQPGETPAAMFFRYWGDHPFVSTDEERLSTFAADVDTASYGLVRRTLRAGRLPLAEQVRTEELVNAFRPDFPAPVRETFALGLELAPSRFGPDAETWMLRAVVRGRDVDALERQPMALTFVVDVSGSMDEPTRLPLVQETLRMLLAELDAGDAVAIVAFRDEAQVLSGMVSAAGQRGALEDAIAAMSASGGTSVEAGLLAGFRLAAEALTPNAVNRVVLLSDGVGNVGETDQARILEQVAELRAKGLYLNTIGVGMGDHHDAFLEQLADRGDGLCDYIDSPESARRALVERFTGAFQPIARDVKIQLELDPAVVAEFRQLGYENRALAHEDFRRDEVDAGEINAGHQVTALYELRLRPVPGSGAPLATLRVRYKPPFAVDGGATSAAAAAEAEVAQEIRATLSVADAAPAWDATPLGYRRAVLVAQLAEHLRRSVHAEGDPFDELVREAERLAPQLRDPDFDELLELMRLAQPLLAAERAAEGPELRALSRELCDLRYRQARRELLHETADEETLAAENERIEALETAIRGAVRARHGLPEAETIEALRGLGYVGGDR